MSSNSLDTASTASSVWSWRSWTTPEAVAQIACSWETGLVVASKILDGLGGLDEDGESDDVKMNETLDIFPPCGPEREITEILAKL